MELHRDIVVNSTIDKTLIHADPIRHVWFTETGLVSAGQIASLLGMPMSVSTRLDRKAVSDATNFYDFATATGYYNVTYYEDIIEFASEYTTSLIPINIVRQWLVESITKIEYDGDCSKFLTAIVNYNWAEFQQDITIIVSKYVSKRLDKMQEEIVEKVNARKLLESANLPDKVSKLYTFKPVDAEIINNAKDTIKAEQCLLTAKAELEKKLRSIRTYPKK
jgi:hypothetical protein